ncbi:protein kinase domain-containing protein [Pontiella desulfatans]|uniref:protein kinase domain-containing protein n=1 Tax=Pontiella desulfatans TaxID=2750659 RepID=UPI00144474A4|nr:protein kinase [Pontiella desulfatans]
MKKIFIEVCDGPETGMSWEFSQETVNIGRTEDNDAILSDLTVSKAHCSIVQVEGAVQVKNVSGSNPTRVNGDQVENAELAHGDIIQLGKTVLKYTLAEELDASSESLYGEEDETHDPETAATMFIDHDSIQDQLEAVDATMETQAAEGDTQANRYTIHSKLAQSGQAMLFHGSDETSGEEVALKLFTHDISDHVSEARFQREIKILERLSHRNIVEYRGVFEVEGEWGESKRYLVMEFLKGKTLKEMIADYPKGMPWEKARDIFEQCLDGLIHAYDEHNVIHRDIKPSNIFILEDGTAKLIDFGISRMDSESTHTGGSGMMGSFDYMAPDFVLRDEPNFRGDMVSDIFSLFACFHEAITGALPYPKFGERQELEYLNRWKAGDARLSNKHIVFRVVSHLSRFFSKGLAADHKERYQTFAKVRSELGTLRNRTINHQNVEEYELLDGLGAGGFGEVYLSRKKSDKELVAVKRLYSNRPNKRFIKEASVLRQYSHPAIVKYLDYFETVSSSGSRNSILVLEYLEGETLNRAVAENKSGMDTAFTLKLFLQYLSALDFLHNAENPIIHRDIKPSNLHVPEDDPFTAKILDMGIVKDVSGTQTSGKLPGTYYYMAPEMFTTNNRGTPQTDIYALGLAFYEALTGQPAFPRLPKNDKDAIVEMVERSQGKKEYRINYGHESFKQCHDLINIVQKAIQQDPQTRYASAAAMWEDVADVLCRSFAFPAGEIDKLRSATLVQGEAADLSRFIDPGDLRPGKKGRVAKGKGKGRGVVFVLVLFLLGAAAGVGIWKRDALLALINNKFPALGKTVPVVASAPVAEPVAPADPVAEPVPVVEAVPVPEVVAEPQVVPVDEKKGLGSIFAKEVDVSDLVKDIEDEARNYPEVIDYNGLSKACEARLKTYFEIIEDERSGKPEVLKARRVFWEKQIAYVMDAVADGSTDLLAIARGQFFAALPCHALDIGTSKVDSIFASMTGNIEARMDVELPEGQGVADYLPLRKSTGFEVWKTMPNDAAGQYLRRVVGTLPFTHKAKLFPENGRLKLTSETGTVTREEVLDFVLVPNGFRQSPMGDDGFTGEEVRNPFYLSKTEVSKQVIRCFKDSLEAGERASIFPTKRFTGSGPFDEGAEDLAILFCNWLSRADGLEELYSRTESGGWALDLRRDGYRLPFDYEWEYAARFGFDFGPESGRKSWQEMAPSLDRKNELVWYYEKSEPREKDTAHAYPLGVYDMCGNVEEICMASLADQPEGQMVVDLVTRGGGSASRCSIAQVMPWSGGQIGGESIYGFRVVRPLPFHDF